MSPEILIGGSSIVLTLLIIAITAVMALFTIAITVIPFVLIFRSLAKSAAQQQQLLAEGEPGTAEILAAAQTGTWINNSPQIRFHLRIQRQDGSQYETMTTSMVNLIQLAQVQPGSRLSVRIDRTNPQNVALVL